MYITTEPENQDQMWLPMNDYTKLLYYDQRLIISTQAMERPITWKVSKVENIHPFGINKLTLSQCKFDPNTDKKVDGWWYADYAAGTVEPMPEPSVVPPGLKLSYTGTNPNIKIGGAEKKYTADFAEGDLNWSFMMENRDIQDRIQVRFDDNSCYISTEDEELVGRVMTIYVTQEDGLQAEIKVGFINL